ncbi:MAG TPA: amidohydrolase family protein [Alphaproteobacteria bacterium]|nr:amidohydrolase family protein [Alphaproteobacteria bacterium]
MTVIDVHTHMLSEAWFELIKRKGAPRYEVKPSKDWPAPLGIHSDGAPFMTPQPGHFDYKLRLEKMDEARVDLAIVSLTAPNCYFGSAKTSLKAAQLVNDDMAEAQRLYPDRIRWLASLPWEHPTLAVEELKRACKKGAVGVIVLANVAERSLTEPLFAPIWKEIDKRGLPVLVHPTAPQGVKHLDMRRFNLVAQIGFMFDTSLAIARMIYSGFLDRHPNLKIIAAHAGAALPYLAGRMDICYDNMHAVRENISAPPRDYLNRIWYDAVTYRQDALEMCINVGGEDKVMYGSDWPHNIGDMKGCLGRVNSLPSRVRKAVSSANAERIFKL